MRKKANEDYRAVSLWWSGTEESLNTQQLQIYSRIDFADNMIRKYGGGKQTAKMIFEKFKNSFSKYSLRQAYIDMEFAVELMNSVGRKSKEMDKLYAIEILKKQIARVIGDVRGKDDKIVGMVKDPEKQAMAVARLLKELRETTGYHLPDIDLPDFSDMGGNVYRVTTNPEDVGMRKVEITEDIKRKYAEPKAKLFDRMEQDAEDIEHTEINE